MRRSLLFATLLIVLLVLSFSLVCCFPVLLTSLVLMWVSYPSRYDTHTNLLVLLAQANFTISQQCFLGIVSLFLSFLLVPFGASSHFSTIQTPVNSVACKCPTSNDLNVPTEFTQFCLKISRKHCFISSFANNKIKSTGRFVLFQTMHIIQHPNKKLAYKTMQVDIQLERHHDCTVKS